VKKLRLEKVEKDIARLRKKQTLTLGELIKYAIDLAEVGEGKTMGQAMDMELVMPDFLPVTGVTIHMVGKKMVFAISDTEG